MLGTSTPGRHSHPLTDQHRAEPSVPTARVGFLVLCMNMAPSQSSHSPPEHRCPRLLAGHVPHTQHGPLTPGEGAAACSGAQAWSMCVRKVSILGVPPPRSCTGPEHGERFVHLAAKQNKMRFLCFPTQLPRLALFPVFIFVHILVLFYGRTPQPVPTCSSSSKRRLSRWKVCRQAGWAGSQASEQEEGAQVGADKASE